MSGRGVFITGGAGRIGRAIAEVFLRDGFRVAVCDVDAAALAAMERDLGAHAGGGAFFSRAADATNEHQVEDAFVAAEGALGRIDTLVTCAAIYPNVALIDCEVDEWDRVFAVNVRGVMLACRTVARAWIARGSPGSIVNLSSGAARSARRGASAYCASKAALEMLGDVLATELGPHGIRVNAVAPGLVMDEVVRAADGERHPYYDAMLAATPLGRTGDALEIAEAVAFLASDRSRWTTGAVLEVTGGSHCGRTHLAPTGNLAQRGR